MASFAVDSCDIVDDYTVTINLKYAYGNFLNMLWYCAIIDSDHYSSMSEEEFARNPVGTGRSSLPSGRRHSMWSWRPTRSIGTARRR